MRIVLISYHFPPAPEVGGLRAVKVAEALRQAGHEVHVIAGQVPAAMTPLTRLPSGVVVERVRSWRSPREFWAAHKRRRTHSGAPSMGDPGGGNEQVALPPRVPFWKRVIFSFLWLPDDHQGFIVPAIAAARRAFAGGPDLVYTSAPPFSTHLVGLRLAGRGVRWIAEFRDPWTDNPWKPPHVRTAWTDRIERWLERHTLRRAERVVAVSAGIARGMRAKLPVADAQRVMLVRNGIEWLAPDPIASRTGGPRRIVHVGSFYYGRDPLPFLEAFAATVERYGLTPASVQVDLVGKCRWYNGVSIEGEVARLGLRDFVSFQDWVPHDACQVIVRDADVLLLLAQNQPDQVPNKLYEYLGTRRPILAFADDAGETAELLRTTGGHALVTSGELEDAVRGLELALGLGEERAAPATSGQRLDEWTTEAQMKPLVEAVRNGR